MCCAGTGFFFWLVVGGGALAVCVFVCFGGEDPVSHRTHPFYILRTQICGYTFARVGGCQPLTQ